MEAHATLPSTLADVKTRQALVNRNYPSACHSPIEGFTARVREGLRSVCVRGTGRRQLRLFGRIFAQHSVFVCSST